MDLVVFDRASHCPRRIFPIVKEHLWCLLSRLKEGHWHCSLGSKKHRLLHDALVPPCRVRRGRPSPTLGFFFELFALVWVLSIYSSTCWQVWQCVFSLNVLFEFEYWKVVLVKALKLDGFVWKFGLGFMVCMLIS